jgi:catechol 2,3-dioxygenase-like lactoylglutathione lyase family enzyme
MSIHSDVYEQLVIELYVRDFKASCTFYQAFGFRMVRDEGDFAELQTEHYPHALLVPRRY